MAKIKKVVYIPIICLIISIIQLCAINANNVRATTISQGEFVYELNSGRVISSHNENKKLPMASTTKILTCITAIENFDLNTLVEVKDNCVGIEGSSIYLKKGERLTIKELLYGLMLRSGNDCAECIASSIISRNEFISLMNETARKIGATNSNFTNPHGLHDENHYTTAHDLAIIASEALKNKTFAEIVSTYKHRIPMKESGYRYLMNHNKMLRIYDGAIGVKTGFTKKSGRCLVSAAERDGVTLVAVTLNDPDDWADHKNMLDNGFSKLESVNLDEIVNIPDSIPTVSSDGVRVNVEIKTNNIVKLIDEEIDYSVDLPTYIARDIKHGDKLGEVTLRIDGREEKIDVIATNDVKIRKPTRRFL